MKKQSYFFITLLAGLILFLGVQIATLHLLHADNARIKYDFVAFSSLPDLAIANEALFVRFRSYADTFSLFSNGPELLEYAPSTFTYHHAHTENSARIERAH